jgi:hypothetical protein
MITPDARTLAVPAERGVRRAAALQAAALGAAALALDVAFDPVHRHVPLCPFHVVTGWWCPLCGGLRAADSLAHGQLGAALHYNVLFVAALPFALLLWLDWLRTGRLRGAESRRALTVLLVVAVVFTVLRNLPFAATLRGG